MENPANPSTPVPPVTETTSQPIPQQPGTLPGTIQSSTPQPQTLEATPPEQPYIPEKKPFPKKFILIAIIVVIVGIGGGMLFGKNKSTSPKTSKTTSNATTPKPQQPGFNTYTNSANKFSIQYPDKMQVKENTVGMGVSTIEMRSEDNLDEDYLADIQMMTIPNYLAKAIGQDFDEYYNMSENTSKTITAQEQSRILTKLRNRSVNNLRAFEFKSTDDSPSANEEATIGVYIEIDDKILIISTQEGNRDNLEKMLENFNYTP